MGLDDIRQSNEREKRDRMAREQIDRDDEVQVIDDPMGIDTPSFAAPRYLVLKCREMSRWKLVCQQPLEGASNWDSWKDLVFRALGSIGCQIGRGDLHRLSPEDDMSIAVQLLNALSKSLYETYSSSHSAALIWLALENALASTAAEKNNDLWDEISNLKTKRDETGPEFLTRAEQMFVKHRRNNPTTSFNFYTNALTRGCNGRYGEIISYSILEARDSLTEEPLYQQVLRIIQRAAKNQ